MHKTDFSIIIPTYNRAQELSVAISSVLRQSSDNWNLLIIDDGSIDNTREKIQKYLYSDKIIYKYQKHSGVSSARNCGIELSETDYIIFLDSDDELNPNLIRDLSETDFYNYDLIFWEVEKKIGDKTVILKPKRLEEIYNGLVGIFLSGSVCYRKKSLEKAGGFDSNLKFGENYELAMRIAQLPELNTLILNQIYLKYNLNENFRSNSEPKTKLDSLEYLLTKHEEIYLKDPLSHSRLLYQIGYLNERLGDKRQAIRFYKRALNERPFYIKPLLKILLYNIQ